MRTRKNTIKNIFCATTGLAMLGTASVGAFKLFNENTIYAEASQATESIAVSISNSNFNSNTKYSMPFSPNNYTANNIDSEVSGVVSLDSDTYNNKFPNAKRSYMDNYVLMLDSNGNQANCGYTTSTATKLDANSNYMFTVDVYTLENAGIANLYLLDSDDNNAVFSKHKGISSYQGWSTYYFFVSTNEKALNLKLQMTLEGKGTALFDNISCHKISNNLLNNHVSGSQKLDDSIFEYENNVDNIVKSYITSNVSFVNAADNTETHAVSTGLGTFDLSSVIDETDGTNKGALKLSVDKNNATYAFCSTDDNFLTFKNNTIYRVSVNVKTTELTGKATLKLVQTNLEDEEKSTDSEVIEISTNTGKTENVTNDYASYSFYVKSHPSKSTTYKLEFALGDATNNASGNMFISNVEVATVNQSAYSSAPSTAKKVDLSKVNDVDYDITNGQFDEIEIDDYNNRFPATPSNWKVTKGKHDQYYGVVNTDDANFAELSSIDVHYNPDQGKSNNVLMLCNTQADTLSYTSETKSINAKTYNKIDVKVKTYLSNVKVALVTTKNDNEIELASQTISADINSPWQIASLYLYSGYNKLDVAVKITMTTEQTPTSLGFGYAFIDNVFTDPGVNEIDFKAAASSNKTATADLSDIFSSTGDDNYNAKFFNYTQDVDTVKIIDMKNEILTGYVPTDYLSSFTSNNVDKVLAIRSLSDVNYSVTSNIGFTISSNKYYKISFDVYTNAINSNKADAKVEDLGAVVGLSGLENATFTKVVSKYNWTTYTLYVTAKSETTAYLTFGLGSEENPCKGDLFISNIQFVEDLEESAFNEVTESSTIKLIKPAEEPEEEKEETTEEEKESNFNWIYLIPSIAFPLAIIICIVGVALRKVKWKKPVKKTKNTYDRNRTVSKQVLSRKATAIREERIISLTKELNELTEERTKYEEQYKVDLTKLREMKIKRANPVEISKLEKEMKKNQKLSASVGISINKVKEELDHTQTDAYLNNLMKKLEREPAKVEEETDSTESK